MNKRCFAVFSYDADEQQGFVDLVHSENETQAMERVAAARPYALVAMGMDLDECEHLVRNMRRSTESGSETRLDTLAEAAGITLEGVPV